MLTPQTLQKLPDEMVELVSEVQTDIIKSIAKKLVKADYLTPSAEWQLYKASQLRMSTNEVTDMLAKFTGKSKRQISKLYTTACKEAINNDAKIYRAYGKDCSAALRSVALSNTLKAGIKNANGMTKNLCRSMVESSQATVTHLMDRAWLEVASGAFTPQEAIYNAVSELAAQGIQSVAYPSGHTDWADVAVRRAVMTGISQTAGQMQLDLAAEMDCDLVEVTAHMGARPSHALWQGKVYSISGKSKKYPKLSTATGCGRGDGLKGWNCRHDFFPFFEGISERANLPVDISENNEQYALEQKQRSMERSIRKTKRRLAAFDGAVQECDDEVLKCRLLSKFERHSAILKTKEKRLAEFCNANGLYPQNDRVRVVGFNKSVSQKAVWANKKHNTPRESIFTDMFEEFNNGQKDVIKLRNIEKELEKSEIGREIKEYLKTSPCQIRIYYGVDVRTDLLGIQNPFDNSIEIYASNTKTVARTSEVIIHELTHRRFNIGGDFWSECVCKAQELKHRNRRNYLTISEKRSIIKDIKANYGEMHPNWKWRSRL